MASFYALPFSVRQWQRELPLDCQQVLLSIDHLALHQYGVWYFAALRELAIARYEDCRIECLCDVGEDAGLALAALRAGFRQIIYRGDAAAFKRLAALLKQEGGTLYRRMPAQSGLRYRKRAA